MGAARKETRKGLSRNTEEGQTLCPVLGGKKGRERVFQGDVSEEC